MTRDSLAALAAAAIIVVGHLVITLR